jgi:tetratricopeptide (TPR) repeat protein
MFAVMLTPAFYFKGITGGFIYAERYLYLASFPAVVLVSLFVLRLPPRASAAVAIVLVALSSAAVILRNPDWRSDEVVYSRSVEANPDSLYAWLGLATARTNLGNYSGAENALRKAERLLSDTRYIQLPDSGYRVYLGLGTVAARRNMPDEAKSHLIKALELNPQGENAYTILAGILMNFERNAAAAMPLLKKAIELDPLDDQARDSMGVALYNVGRYEEAVGHFQEALRINPQSELAQQHLQRVMQKLGRR